MSTQPHQLQTINDALCPLVGIELGQMDAIKLMNRVDTKYVTGLPTLEKIIEKAGEDGYRVFSSGEGRVHPYDSVYFDTPERRMFLDQRNSHLVRQKVRTRVYRSSSLCFLEVKKKNNHGRTKKTRIEIPEADFYDFRADDSCREFLTGKTGYRNEDLAPSLETIYDRITLVDRMGSERITMDSSVRFRNLRNGQESSLGDLVIIELKRDRFAQGSMKDILLTLRVKPMRISKYCTGVALTDPLCRPGRFLGKIRMLEKLENNLAI